MQTHPEFDKKDPEITTFGDDDDESANCHVISCQNPKMRLQHPKRY